MQRTNTIPAMRTTGCWEDRTPWKQEFGQNELTHNPHLMLKLVLKRTRCLMFHYNHMIPPNTLSIAGVEHSAPDIFCGLLCPFVPPAAGCSERASTRSHVTLFFTKYILKGPMSIEWWEVFVLSFVKGNKNWQNKQKKINQGKLIKSLIVSDLEIICFIILKWTHKRIRLVLRSHNRGESHYIITTGHVSMRHLQGRAAENYLSFIFFPF